VVLGFGLPSCVIIASSAAWSVLSVCSCALSSSCSWSCGWAVGVHVEGFLVLVLCWVVWSSCFVRLCEGAFLVEFLLWVLSSGCSGFHSLGCMVGLLLFLVLMLLLAGRFLLLFLLAVVDGYLLL